MPERYRALRKFVSWKGQKKVFFTLLLSGTMIITTPVAHADVWGAAWGASILKQVMENLARSLEGAIMGSLKTAAFQMLNSQIGQLIGGTKTGQALFITDMESFLYQQPGQEAALYMNDFFARSTRGGYASANYVGVGDVGRDVIGSYKNYLVAQAKIAAFEGIATGIQGMAYDLDSYTPDPSRMFETGDWRAFNAFISNPSNNPFGFSLNAQAVMQDQLTRNIEKQKLTATSPGFLPKVENGVILAPAATIEALTTNVQDIGNKMVAAASNPGEFLSGVVVSMVNQVVNRVVQKGVGEIQAKMQREINNVDNKIMTEIYDLRRQAGPAVNYLNRVNTANGVRNPNQSTNVRASTDTPAPPQPTYDVQFGGE